MNPTYEAALSYIEKGWSVIPLKPNSKRPAIDWSEFQNRQATEEELKQWFQHDGMNIGIATGATSNLVVVDCDSKQAASELMLKGYYSPVTVITRKGKHLYFSHPGVETRNSAGSLSGVMNVDLRGDGGYVVAPPSVVTTDGQEHTYTWDCAIDDDELPRFQRSEFSEDKVDGFDFSELDLSGIRSYGQSCWDESKAHIQKIGRKLRDGEGRNNRLTAYIGECIASGMTEGQTRSAIASFQAEFFAEALPHAEVETSLRSIIQADMRQHPDRHASATNATGQLVDSKNWKTLLQSKEAQYLMEPYIPKASIVQVVGFNGHGKSLWLGMASWAMASGKNFATGLVRKPSRVLYLDFEMSTDMVGARFSTFESALGDMSENFKCRIASMQDVEMNLMEKQGTDMLSMFLNETQPECVVIDTCRSAWQGFEENSPHGWSRINKLAKFIRDKGCTVILVHHRNKPGQNGMGREAGSTAQLTDIDTQIIVTRVCETVDEAREVAGLPDTSTSVKDMFGHSRTAFSYLRMVAGSGIALKTVFQVSFGKVRTMTENHKPAFIGLGFDVQTEQQVVVHTPLAWDKARRLMVSGKSLNDIAMELNAPLSAIKRWVEL